MRYYHYSIAHATIKLERHIKSTHLNMAVKFPVKTTIHTYGEAFPVASRAQVGRLELEHDVEEDAVTQGKGDHDDSWHPVTLSLKVELGQNLLRSCAGHVLADVPALVGLRVELVHKEHLERVLEDGEVVEPDPVLGDVVPMGGRGGGNKKKVCEQQEIECFFLLSMDEQHYNVEATWKLRDTFTFSQRQRVYSQTDWLLSSTVLTW